MLLIQCALLIHSQGKQAQDEISVDALSDALGWKKMQRSIWKECKQEKGSNLFINYIILWVLNNLKCTLRICSHSNSRNTSNSMVWVCKNKVMKLSIP